MILSLPNDPGLWCFQHVILECCCVTRLFGSAAQQLRRGDYWHCLHHNLPNVLVVDILPATVADREALTRTEQ